MRNYVCALGHEKCPAGGGAQSGEGLFGFAVVLLAPRAQRAFAAQGVLSLAHPSTVENQPVVRVAPPVLRNQRAQLHLRLDRKSVV